MSSPVRNPSPSASSYQDTPSEPLQTPNNIPNNTESSFLNPPEARSICSYIAEAGRFLSSLAISIFQHIHTFFSALWERFNHHAEIPPPIAPSSNTLVNPMHSSVDLTSEPTADTVVSAQNLHPIQAS